MTAAARPRRVAVVDAALALVVGTLGLVDTFSGRLSAEGPGSPVLGAVGVIASALLLSQRRLRPPLVLAVFPVWVTLGLLFPEGPPALFYGTLVPFLLATYSIARHGAGRTPWVGVALALGALGWAQFALPALGGWSGFVFNAAAIGGAFAVGLGLRRSEERAVIDAVRAAAAEERSRRAARDAVSAERARIAHDLHDLLGHSMSAMVVQAGAAEQVVGEDPAAVRRALHDIRATGTTALAEVRRVVALLRDPVDDDVLLDPTAAARSGLEPFRRTGDPWTR
jgi:signal transduction histidine kinase